MTNETTPTVAESPRRTRRQGAKASKPSEKIKTAVNLSPRAFELLGVHCAVENRTQSDLIEELILRGLNRYAVYRRNPAGRGESATAMESAA